MSENHTPTNTLQVFMKKIKVKFKVIRIKVLRRQNGLSLTFLYVTFIQELSNG